jgi:hypothetical protein
MQSELKKGIRDGGLLRAFFHTYAINLISACPEHPDVARGGVVLKLSLPVLKSSVTLIHETPHLYDTCRKWQLVIWCLAYTVGVYGPIVTTI